ncbi:mitochondrial Usp domain-containing protein [Andalucia godoyi]|uniref:Mitochondrial Usp domain-containing protein n=1 Tax=Andalucia godoyi TaxID=505711 RepID=A0A8K0AGV7_ANDGO|nr:mitochondrial Usp domain-containing protein [Andalucia godoyi]|eukprot:ANDGO_06294.mRNA.1 mitochondrial Usp domain-containing protein
MKIIIAVDGSKSADACFDFIRANFNLSVVSDLILLTAVEGPSSDAVYISTELTRDIAAQCDTLAAATLDRIAHLAKDAKFAKITRYVAHGRPQQVILDAVESFKADLLVVGRQGRTAAAQRVLMGSVSEFLVRNSPCTVAVVKM